MNKIVVTGAGGFIGSHVAEHLVEAYPHARIVLLDKMTYSAHSENFMHLLARDLVSLVVGDICDLALCDRVVRDADVVVHLAAESHVDNSFGNSLAFTTTNVIGTHTLIESCRKNTVPRVIHISTDEVYGDALTGSCDENAPFSPTNPYSASKAAAEMILMSYNRSFQFATIVVRANNIFGIRQYPEKIIPCFCMSLIHGRKLPVHGDGKNFRHYLSVHDFADAVLRLIRQGIPGEVYNVGSEEEYSNLQVAQMVCDQFAVSSRDHVEFVADRPFNDRRYSISSAKIQALGWRPQRKLVDEIGGIVQWYRDNAHRYDEF